MAKTADRLLSGLKRRGVVPANEALYSDSDLLAIADDVIEGEIVPMLMGIRQDYFVTFTTQALTADVAAYDIPYRAIGRTLRDAKLVDGTLTSDLTLESIEDEHLFSTSGTPVGFYFRGDKIVLVPAPSTATPVLKLWYNQRVSRLVKLDEAAVVVSATTTTVTVSSAISGITTGTVVDFVQAKSGSSTRAIDKTIQNATGTTYTFTSGDIPTDLVAGDYISVSETSPVIQLPDECFPLLETRTTQRILRALGDFEGAGALDRDANDEEKNLKALLEPRIQGENTIILNRNGLLRGAKTRNRRGVIF